MIARATKVWQPGEYEAALVAPAVSGDKTREHLCKAFGRVLNGRGFLCGTDGHRLHAVECEAWQGYKRDDAPPAEQLIPWDAKWRGKFDAVALEDARCFSTRWVVGLEVQPQAMLLHASARTGSGKKAKLLYPLGRDGMRVDYFKLEQLSYSFGIALCYLLDAVDFIGAGSVHVWSKDAAEHQDLEPLAFTAPGVKALRDAARVAVVMPGRI